MFEDVSHRFEGILARFRKELEAINASHGTPKYPIRARLFEETTLRRIDQAWEKMTDDEKQDFLK